MLSALIQTEKGESFILTRRWCKVANYTNEETACRSGFLTLITDRCLKCIPFHAVLRWDNMSLLPCDRCLSSCQNQHCHEVSEVPHGDGQILKEQPQCLTRYNLAALDVIKHLIYSVLCNLLHLQKCRPLHNG